MEFRWFTGTTVVRELFFSGVFDESFEYLIRDFTKK